MHYLSDGAGKSAMCKDVQVKEELIEQESPTSSINQPSQSSELSFEYYYIGKIMLVTNSLF